jgi:hypothetical protein
MIRFFGRIWKDPVWSKVLAAAICATAAAVGSIAYEWWVNDRALVSVLATVFVITSVLQSLMAATFLIDRILERRRETEEQNRAIAYQVAPAGAVIIRDETNEKAEFQLRVALVNSSSYPLRYQVISTKAEIDERVNPSDRPNYVPGILPVGGMTQVRFNSYARGRLPSSGPLRGRVEMVYRYGHAAGEFVFESRRVYSLKCDLRETANKNVGPGPGGAFPVELVVVSEENHPLPRRGSSIA